MRKRKTCKYKATAKHVEWPTHVTKCGKIKDISYLLLAFSLKKVDDLLDVTLKLTITSLKLKLKLKTCLKGDHCDMDTCTLDGGWSSSDPRLLQFFVRNGGKGVVMATVRHRVTRSALVSGVC